MIPPSEAGKTPPLPAKAGLVTPSGEVEAEPSKLHLEHGHDSSTGNSKEEEWEGMINLDESLDILEPAALSAHAEPVENSVKQLPMPLIYLRTPRPAGVVVFKSPFLEYRKDPDAFFGCTAEESRIHSLELARVNDAVNSVLEKEKVSATSKLTHKHLLIYLVF